MLTSPGFFSFFFERSQLVTRVVSEVQSPVMERRMYLESLNYLTQTLRSITLSPSRAVVRNSHLCNGLNGKNLVKPSKTCFIAV